MTPWIMASSVRWFSWISPSVLVSEGVSVFMATEEWGGGGGGGWAIGQGSAENEVDKTARRQPENCTYSLARHKVRLKPSCCMRGPRLGPTFAQPLLATRASAALIC